HIAKFHFNLSLVFYKIGMLREALLELDHGLYFSPDDEKARKFKKHVKKKLLLTQDDGLDVSSPAGTERIHGIEAAVAPVKESVRDMSRDIAGTTATSDMLTFRSSAELEDYKQDIIMFVKNYLDTKWSNEFGDKWWAYDDVLVIDDSERSKKVKDVEPIILDLDDELDEETGDFDPYDAVIDEIVDFRSNINFQEDPGMAETCANNVDKMMEALVEINDGLKQLQEDFSIKRRQYLDRINESMSRDIFHDPNLVLDPLSNDMDAILSHLKDLIGNINRIINGLDGFKKFTLLPSVVDDPRVIDESRFGGNDEGKVLAEEGGAAQVIDDRVIEPRILDDKKLDAPRILESRSEIPEYRDSYQRYLNLYDAKRDCLDPIIQVLDSGEDVLILRDLQAFSSISLEDQIEGKSLKSRPAAVEHGTVGFDGTKAPNKVSPNALNLLGKYMLAVKNNRRFKKLLKENINKISGDKEQLIGEIIGSGVAALAVMPYSTITPYEIQPASVQIKLSDEAMVNILKEIEDVKDRAESQEWDCNADRDLFIENQCSKFKKMAIELYENAEYEDALRIFKALLDLIPEDKELLFNLGFTLRELEDFKESERVFKMLLEYQYDNAYGWYNLAILYLLMNQPEKELYALRMAKQFGYIIDDNRLIQLARTYPEKNPFDET
ncbi:MAG: tetratricopeptide repeat protein, partial [Promethearchaeota archaeon]